MSNMDPETNMSSVTHLNDRRSEMITRCKQFRELLKNLKKGVFVSCCLCRRSTPSDHRTNHLKHFIYNHLTEYDDKETVFKLLEINACNTYNACWKRGIARAQEKKSGNVSKRKRILESDSISGSPGITDPDHDDSLGDHQSYKKRWIPQQPRISQVRAQERKSGNVSKRKLEADSMSGSVGTTDTDHSDSLRNHQSYKKRWISQHHADTNDPGSSDDLNVPRAKERIVNPKKSVGVYPHLNSCDSPKKSSIKSRKISSNPRKLDVTEGGKYSINGNASRYQAYNSCSNLSTRDSRSLATASNHLSYSSEGLVGTVDIKGTKNYDEEIACMVLLQLASADRVVDDNHQDKSITDDSTNVKCTDTPTTMVSEKTKINCIKSSSSPVPPLLVNCVSTSATDPSSFDDSLQPEGVKLSQYSQGVSETTKTFAPVVSNSPLCHNTIKSSSFHPISSAFTSVQATSIQLSADEKSTNHETSRSSDPVSTVKVENGSIPRDRNGERITQEKCLLKVHVSPNHVTVVTETSSSTSVKKESECLHDTHPPRITCTRNLNENIQTAIKAPVKNSHEPNVVELTPDESVSVKCETIFAENSASERTQDNYASLNAPKMIIPMIYPTLPSTSTQSNSITSNSSSFSSSSPSPLQASVR